jgi:hypothetical protein
MAVLELDQLTARSVRTVPAASRAVADTVAVSPAVSARLDGETTTDATGTAVTSTPADDVNAPEAALTEVLPIDAALTAPDAETGATAVFALDHVIS